MDALRVCWLTNLPAPYRVTIFAELAKLVRLEVLYLAGQDRERDWHISETDGHRRSVLHAHRFAGTSGERSIWIAGRGLARHLRSADVVVLGSWESPAYWQALATAKLLAKPVVIFYESTLHTNRYSGQHPISILRRKIMQSADAVITAGQASTDAVCAMGVDSARIITGFNTVAVDDFATEIARLRAEREEAVKESPTQHTFLFAGRPLPRKNLAGLLTAYGRGFSDGDRLLVAGTYESAQVIKGRLEDLPPGVRETITFLGPVSTANMPEVYAQAQTLVLPSHVEVWGMVVNEALAGGLHVVVSTGAGVAASVSHMPGVFTTNAEPASLEFAMSESRAQWAGPVPRPLILDFTPIRSAEDYRDGILLAQSSRQTFKRRSRSLTTVLQGRNPRS